MAKDNGGQVFPPPKYQDECRMLRMHLVDLLARPSLGSRSWIDTLRIGAALMELDRQAESMDREAAMHNCPDRSMLAARKDTPDEH